MTEPLPRQRRHVERMTNGPVFTVSYRMRGRIHTVGNTTDKNAPCSAAASLFSYHSRPIAGVAVLDLGARLVTSTITAPTGCVYFNGYFFVDSLCCLSECQVHKILYRQNGQKWFTYAHEIENNWITSGYKLLVLTSRGCSNMLLKSPNPRPDENSPKIFRNSSSGSTWLVCPVQ